MGASAGAPEKESGPGSGPGALSRAFGLIGGGMGLLSVGWALAARPELGGDLAARADFLHVRSGRVRLRRRPRPLFHLAGGSAGRAGSAAREAGAARLSLRAIPGPRPLPRAGRRRRRGFECRLMT